MQQRQLQSRVRRGKITLMDLPLLWFRLPTTVKVSCDAASHEEFRAFATSLVTLEGDAMEKWDPFERRNFLNYLRQHEVEIPFVEGGEENVTPGEDKVIPPVEAGEV